MNKDSYSNSSTLFSTGSIRLDKPPIELTTKLGYLEFIKRTDEENCQTILKEDFSQGFIINNDRKVIAKIYGEAKDYLINEATMD